MSCHEDGCLLGCSTVNVVEVYLNFYQSTRRNNPHIFIIAAVRTSNPTHFIVLNITK
jgi:hypothetical protein